MGTRLRKQKPATANRLPPKQRILEAAAERFLELGFERTGMTDIARSAKVSKRELYTFFGDKRAILTAVIQVHQDEVQNRMSGLWETEEDIHIVLPQAAAELAKIILSERFGKLIRIVAAESYHNPEAAKRFYQLGPALGRKRTARYLKSQMEKGRMRVADPIKAADDFMDLVIGAQLMTAVILGQADQTHLRRDHVEHAVEMFMRNYAVTSSGHKR